MAVNGLNGENLERLKGGKREMEKGMITFVEKNILLAWPAFDFFTNATNMFPLFKYLPASPLLFSRWFQSNSVTHCVFSTPKHCTLSG